MKKRRKCIPKDSLTQSPRPSGHPEPESVDLICGPEAYDLHRHFTHCPKDASHIDFIPLHTFREEHFPEGYRHAWRVDRVRAMAELTVLLKVCTVSKNRPAFYPDSNDQFPFYSSSGKSQPRAGTGFVKAAYRCGEGGDLEKNKWCSCRDCVGCGDQKESWWKLWVVTASHVCYDESEIVGTEVTFFYDSKDSVTTSALGHGIVSGFLEADKCVFSVILHDAATGERLQTACEAFNRLATQHKETSEDPVFVVSHPHGCPKHVTVSQEVKQVAYMLGQSLCFCLTYTAATCPGSSGAAVCGPWRDELWNLDHHCEGLDTGWNMSGGGWLWR